MYELERVRTAVINSENFEDYAEAVKVFRAIRPRHNAKDGRLSDFTRSQLATVKSILEPV